MSKSKSESSILVSGNSLAKIPYSDKPLSQGGEIIYLSPEQFKEKFNCTYTESLFGNREKFSQYINNQQLCTQLKSNPDLPHESLVRQRLEQPLDAFVICKISDEVGYGLFAKQDISAGTILFIYSGVVCDGREFSEGDDYQFNWIQNTTTATDAKQIGGLSRFMQHLPMDYKRHRENLKNEMMRRFGALLIGKENKLESGLDEMMSKIRDNEINEIIFNNKKSEQQLANANVNIMSAVINGVPITICISLYDGIKKNEQIGFSYGTKYWACKSRSPRFFIDNGELIPLTDYYHKHDLIKSNNNNALLVNQNPLVNYQQAIEHYKIKKYNTAIKYLDLAIDGFVNKKGENSEEALNCHSTYASCFRELGLFDNAIKAIEKALHLASQLNSNEQEPLLKKYQQIVEKSGLTGTEIYQKAVNLYKDKQFVLSMTMLQLLLTKFEEEKASDAKKVTCHSTLSSCYREMGDLEKAIEYCKLAIGLCQGKNTLQSLKKECESKLEKIMALENNTIKLGQ